MKFSIIIPAYNEEGYIEKALNSIKNQYFKDYEVLVVANGCTDKTVEIAKVNGTRVVQTREKGISLAKNIGGNLSNGEFLVFLDADTQLDQNSLEKINECLNTGCVAGTCKVLPDNNKWVARTGMKFKTHFAKMGNPNGIVFCKKDVFDKIKFREDLKKSEDNIFFKEAKKFGEFGVADTYVITSMRRYEKWGYVNVFLYWVKEYFFPSDKEYEVIR